MSTLASLKLTEAKKPAKISQVQARRNKLAQRIAQQIELARAQEHGVAFSLKRMRAVADKETGVRKQVEAEVRVKAWWFTADNGKTALTVRYGSKVLELGKGKCAVEVGQAKDLVKTLELVKTAVLSGELDAAIDTAAVKLREGFAR